MPIKYGFLSDEEKLEYYGGLTDINLKEYPCISTVKVYEGAEFFIYTFKDDGRLKILTSLLVTGVHADEKGLKVNFVDKQRYNLIKVGDIPIYLSGYHIITHTPYRCFVERTVKKTGSGKILQGLASGIWCYTKSDPKSRVPGHNYLIAQHVTRTRFTDQELAEALEEIII